MLSVSSSASESLLYSSIQAIYRLVAGIKRSGKPNKVMSGIGYPFSRRYEEASSTGAGGSGLALSERSEFSQTPAAPSNAACP